MGKIYRSTDKKLPADLRRCFNDFLGQKLMRPFDYAPMYTKAFDPAEEMIIEGIANLAEPDRWGEVIVPSAWNLEQFKKNPIILYEHMREHAIGYALDVQAKDDGLYYRAQIGNPKRAPLTPKQIDVRSLLAQGILKTNSVGFIPHLIEYDEDNDVLRYTDVELIEISIVAIPMQQDSVITSVKSWRKAKSMGGIETKAEEENQEQQEENSEPKLSEVKAMLEECRNYSKGCHEMLTKMSESSSSDEGKALADEVAALKSENEALKTELAELKTKSVALLEKLQKSGIVKPS